MNRALNCSSRRRTGCKEQKRLKYAPPGSGARDGPVGGAGANDRGNAAPEAATARKLMLQPPLEPLLPASDVRAR